MDRNRRENPGLMSWNGVLSPIPGDPHAVAICRRVRIPEVVVI